MQTFIEVEHNVPLYVLQGVYYIIIIMSGYM